MSLLELTFLLTNWTGSAENTELHDGKLTNLCSNLEGLRFLSLDASDLLRQRVEVGGIKGIVPLSLFYDWKS